MTTRRTGVVTSTVACSPRAYEGGRFAAEVLQSKRSMAPQKLSATRMKRPDLIPLSGYGFSHGKASLDFERNRRKHEKGKRVEENELRTFQRPLISWEIMGVPSVSRSRPSELAFKGREQITWVVVREGLSSNEAPTRFAR